MEHDIICRVCGQPAPTVSKRFWERVVPTSPDECWEWQAGERHGYGYIYVHCTGTLTQAHRVAWMLTRGAIPGGLFVCHHCDNRLCVNPNHLFLGSAADNSRDMVLKGRSMKGKPNSPVGRAKRMAKVNQWVLRGEAHGMAKLTKPDVFRIYAMSDDGLSCRDIAPLYGVTPQQVRHIVTGQQWKQAWQEYHAG